MGMSDCPRCWDTPCTCGYMVGNPSRYEMDQQKDRDESRRGEVDQRIRAIEARVTELENRLERGSK